MKDPVHHNGKTQRKVLREARQESEGEELEPHRQEVVEALEEQMGVEIEEQRTVIRPVQRNIH